MDIITQELKSYARDICSAAGWPTPGTNAEVLGVLEYEFYWLTGCGEFLTGASVVEDFDPFTLKLSQAICEAEEAGCVADASIVERGLS